MFLFTSVWFCWVTGFVLVCSRRSVLSASGSSISSSKNRERSIAVLVLLSFKQHFVGFLDDNVQRAGSILLSSYRRVSHHSPVCSQCSDINLDTLSCLRTVFSWFGLRLITLSRRHNWKYDLIKPGEQCLNPCLVRQNAARPRTENSRAVEVAFKKPRFLGFLKKPKKPQKSKF